MDFLSVKFWRSCDAVTSSFDENKQNLVTKTQQRTRVTTNKYLRLARCHELRYMVRTMDIICCPFLSTFQCASQKQHIYDTRLRDGLFLYIF